MAEIAVLLPCCNEARTVGKVVREFRAALPGATVYVYDNNSTDGTAEIARAAGAVVRQETRQGKGNVIRTMFREVTADCYLMTDGDDTYPAESAAELCELVLSGAADMVIGDRLSTTYFSENKRPLHNFGNDLVRRVINWLFQPREKILDVMTGYRAFSPLFVKTFPVLSQGFEIETEMTIHALDKNLLVRSVPVAYRDRPAGSVSKLSTYRDGMRVLGTIFQLFRDYRPLRFFGWAAVCLAAVSLVLVAPIFAEFFETGLVPRLPTFVGCMFLLLAALLSFACGLVLEAKATDSRKMFEMQMNLFTLLWQQGKGK